MADRSFGDHTNRNFVKNPLLSSAVTGLSLDDLTQNAVLLPVVQTRGLILTQDVEKSTQDTTLAHTRDSISSKSRIDEANANVSLGLAPKYKPVGIDNATRVVTGPSKPTESKAFHKSEDDFDVNEYFARLQGTRYVSAPLNAKEDKNANLGATEENLEEINLLEDSPEPSTEDTQQSLTADIAQNFSQLPQVLPHVASAVFSSFSSILNLNRSREITPDTDGRYGQQYGYQDSPGRIDSFQNSSGLNDGLQEDGKSENAGPVPMFSAGDYAPYPRCDAARDLTIAPPGAREMPPIGGTGNTFRLTSKKKTYAHIPGLRTGEFEPSASSQQEFSSFNAPPQPLSVASQNPPFFVPSNVPMSQPTMYPAELKESNQNIQVDLFSTSTAVTDSTVKNVDVNELVQNVNKTAVMAPIEISDFSFKQPPSTLAANNEKGSIMQAVDDNIEASKERSITSCPAPAEMQGVYAGSSPYPATQYAMPAVQATLQSNLPTSFLPSTLQSAISPNWPPRGLPPSVQPALPQSFPRSYLPSVPQATHTLNSPPSYLPPTVQQTMPPHIPPDFLPLAASDTVQTQIAPPPSVPPMSSILPPTSVNRSILPPSVARRITAYQTRQKPIGAEPTYFVPGPPAHDSKESLATLDINPPKAYDNRNLENLPKFSEGTFTDPSNVILLEKSTQEATAGLNIMPIKQEVIPPPSSESVQPSFFNPLAFGIASQNIQPPVQVSENLQQPDTLQSPYYNPSIDIPQPKEALSKPPSIEPPKAVSGGHSFRMLNKKRPQYYSGPIEGIAPMQSAAKPILPPDVTQCSNPAVAFFTPDPIISDLNHSGTGYGASQSLLSGRSVDTPLDISTPVNREKENQITANAPLFDLNVPIGQNYNIQQVPESENVGYRLWKSSESNITPNKDESQAFALFDSLKSKLGSINMNTLQDKVTTFFDPAYISSGTNETDENNQKNNFNFGLMDRTLESEKIEIFVPNIALNEPKQTTQSFYSDPSFNNQLITNYQSHSVYNSQMSEYGNRSHINSNTSYDTSVQHYALTSQCVNPTDTTNIFHHKEPEIASDMCFNTYQNMSKKLDCTDNRDIGITETNLQQRILSEPALVQENTAQYTSEPDIIQSVSINKSDDNSDPVTFVFEDNQKSEQMFYSSMVGEANIPLPFVRGTIPPQFFNPVKTLDDDDAELSIRPEELVKSLLESPSASPNNFNAKDNYQKSSDFFASDRSSAINTNFSKNQVGAAGNAASICDSTWFNDVVKDSIEELNICETCREVKKPEGGSDITSLMIENMTSPLQFFNPVEVPLAESEVVIKDSDDFDANVCAKNCQITKDTIETIHAEESSDLLLKDNIIVDNTLINQSFGNINVPPKEPAKVIVAQSITGSASADSGFITHGDFVNASDEIKAVLQNTPTEMVVKSSIIPRQMSIPSAPPLEAISDQEVDLLERSESCEMSTGGIDINLIEQDAKKDFPDFDEFIIEPSETDDDKLEFRGREPSVELEYLNSEMDMYAALPEDTHYKVESSFFPSLISSIEQEKLTDTTINTRSIPPTKEYKHFPESPEEVKSPISIASYFDTGNYAVESHYRKSQIAAQVFKTTANLESTDDYTIPPSAENAFKSAKISPRSDNSHKNITQKAENEVKSENQKFEIPLKPITNENAVHDTNPFSDNGQLDKNSKHDLVLPDPMQFFGSTISDQVKQPTEGNKADETFNLLASYFTSSGDSLEQSKSFFELSQSQDHFKNERAENIGLDSNENSQHQKPFFELGQSQRHPLENLQDIKDENSSDYLFKMCQNFKRPFKSTELDDQKTEADHQKPFFELSQSENHYIEIGRQGSLQDCTPKEVVTLNNSKLDNNLSIPLEPINQTELYKDSALNELKQTTLKPTNVEKTENSNGNNNDIDLNTFSGGEIEETFLDVETRLASIVTNCKHCYNTETQVHSRFKTRSLSYDVESLEENLESEDIAKLVFYGYSDKFKEQDSDTMDSDNKDSGKDNAEPAPQPETSGEAEKKAKINVTFQDVFEDDLHEDSQINENRNGTEYLPVRHHWFYRVDQEGKSLWRAFSVADNQALEAAYSNPDLSEETLVATDGGRFDVNVLARTRSPVYWTDKPTNVRRCSWFYKGTTDARYVPYTESVAELLEEEYRNGLISGSWHRRLNLPGGESVVLHGPSVMVHFLQGSTPDSWSGSPQSVMRPRVVRRGTEESEIELGEPSGVDHLLLLCHGIGSACDMRFRSVEEVVDDFRATSMQLVQSHYRASFESGAIGRVEVLPISWHSSLHSGETGVDLRLAQVTLDSIPRLRNFTNDTVLDVLFYTSPVFCQTIMDTVGCELNRIYSLFVRRNPTFSGGVSLGGHSLGSLILFDLLCHQPGDCVHEPTCIGSCKRDTAGHVKYIQGSAGTGQPYIAYPTLQFQPQALYALGSPIAIFECIRGVEALGEDFALPTCPAFFNIFHPYDPIAYRIEPLINPELKNLTPLLIPHHKGRKRMHLELKDTMARVGADLRQRLVDSIQSTWANIWRGQPTRDQLKVVQEHLDTVQERDNEAEEGETSETPNTDTKWEGLSSRLGRLNGGRRVDRVLQEAPFEMINEYLFAMTSHVCYWESEDTMLLILREIYDTMGVAPDCTVPQQSMTVDVQRERNGDSSDGVCDTPSTSNAPS